MREMPSPSVLPGVLQNVAAAFPAGTDFARVEAVYWGREEPWRLQQTLIAPEELTKLKATLH